MTHTLMPALLAAAVLGGCATLDTGSGFAAVERSARDRLGKELRWARSEADQSLIDQRVAELLAQPLTADDAVQLALLSNRGLQATFQELGIGAADLTQAGRLPNPGFSFNRLVRGSELEVERGLHWNLARLLALPQLQRLEAAHYAQMQGAVTTAMLTLAADAKKAWINAVAADENVRYMRQVQQAAQAGAELARRMAQVGNFNKLQQAREQAFQADAALSLAQAMQAQRGARERLTRLLGLWGEQTAFRLPERLPDLPVPPIDQPDIERSAMAQRLDVQGAKQAAEQTAQSLGLTRSTRLVNVLELGAVRNGSNQMPTQRGWELSVELPMFDWGDARIARAEATYMQALQRAAETAINARSEVRESYGNYRSAYDIARHHRDEIVPLRKQIADETLLRYNGMLIGVFELLADARLQIASVNASIQALRDFWLAEADLQMALIGKPGLMPGAAATTNTAADSAAAH